MADRPSKPPPLPAPRAPRPLTAEEIAAARHVFRAGDDVGYGRNYVRGLMKFGADGMTPEAKAARKTAMGVPSLNWYHGTANGDFKGFRGDPWLTPSASTASAYADRDAFRNMDEDAWEAAGAFDPYDTPDVDEVPASEMHDVAQKYGEGQAVIRANVGTQKTLDMSELGDSPSVHELASFLQKHGVVGPDVDPNDWDNELSRDRPTLWLMLEELGLDRDIRRAGYDSFKITDVAAGGGANHSAINILDEKVPIRSPFATFDPARANRRDLLAAKILVPLGIAGATYAALQPQPAAADTGDLEADIGARRRQSERGLIPRLALNVGSVVDPTGALAPINQGLEAGEDLGTAAQRAPERLSQSMYLDPLDRETEALAGIDRFRNAVIRGMRPVPSSAQAPRQTIRTKAPPLAR